MPYVKPSASAEDAGNPFNRLVTPRAFGALLNPPVSLRTVYRWINKPDGLPVVELPGGRQWINIDSAWDYLRQRERQTAPRRQGRAA